MFIWYGNYRAGIARIEFSTTSNCACIGRIGTNCDGVVTKRGEIYRFAPSSNSRSWCVDPAYALNMHAILSEWIQAGESVWRILNVNRVAPLNFGETEHNIVDGEIVAGRIHRTVFGVRPSEDVLAWGDRITVVEPTESIQVGACIEHYLTINGEVTVVPIRACTFSHALGIEFHGTESIEEHPDRDAGR